MSATKDGTETQIPAKSARLPQSTAQPMDLQRVLADGIDALPSGFAIFDAEDRAILINKVYREMLPDGAAMLDAGAKFPEMARRNAEAHFGIDEKAIDEWMEKRLAYRDSPKGYFDQQLNDGRWYRIQESRTVEGGTITNWTDITDLKLQEQIAENYADALMSTNHQLQEFAHVASHDLQEPLRKIEVFGGRLRDKCSGQLDEGGERYLNRIMDSSKRMRRLINDLLSFSKIGNTRLDFGPVDMNDVLSDALGTLELSIQEKQANVSVADLPVINGDFAQLSRLFQNLLSNALKYTAPDSPAIIVVSIERSEQHGVEIAVRDNGIGFEQSNAEKIFEVFQRLHGRSSEYDGTGIGLASCRKIVQQHEGNIRAESTPGAGSTFFISLPMENAKIAA